MILDTDARGRTAPVTLELEAEPPFDALGVFEFLEARVIPGVERIDTPGLTYARTILAPGGPASFEVTCSRATERTYDWRVTATIQATDSGDVPAISAFISRLFDLNAHAARIDAGLAEDPALAPLIRARPGMRVPGAVDPAELVIRAVVGQQITVAAARGHLARLTARAGSPVSNPVTAHPGNPGTPDGSETSALTTLFPTPAQIVDAVPFIGPRDELDPDRPLRLPRRQSNAVRAAAEALATGALDARAGADPATFAAQLATVPGVGPWTAAYVALRVFGDSDAWMLGDVALVAGARAIRILPSTRQGSKQAEHRALAARAEQWAPWRSYASMHLWRAAASPASNRESNHAVK